MWHIPLPLPLWVLCRQSDIASAINPDGRLCCFVFTSEDAAKGLAESAPAFSDASIRSMDKIGLQDTMASAKKTGITHVVIDHEQRMSFTIDIDDFLANVGRSAHRN